MGCSSWLSAGLTLLALSGGSAGAAQAPRLIEAWARVDAYVAQRMAIAATPGLALVVTDADRTLRESYYGQADRDAGRPVTADTLFEIGSITKSFTAIALLRQQEAGRLELQAPITDYLPWFTVRSRYAPITAHHLLTHSAGIPADRDDFPSTPFMAYALREQSTAWPPGERFLYSNIGYQVLHVLLEKVADRSYAALIREAVLEPLGMRRSEPVITQAIRGRLATGYVSPYDDRPPHRSDGVTTAPFFEYGIGDGSIAATAADMARYVRMLLNGGRGPAGPILEPASFERLTTAWIAQEDGTGYGYGLAVVDQDGRTVLRHSGGMIGYLSMLMADLDTGLGVVVLHNGLADPTEIAEFALACVRNALAGEPLPPLPSPADPLHVEAAADYAGVFQAGDGHRLQLEAAGDRLFALDGPRRLALERVAADVFQVPAEGLDRYYLVFGRNAAGVVVELSHGPRWYVNQAYTGPREFDLPARWQQFAGSYISQSPWFPRLTVVLRKDALWAISGVDSLAAPGGLRLWSLGDGAFRPGEPPTPERVEFDTVVDGQAWRARWSGHLFYRESRSLGH